MIAVYGLSGDPVTNGHLRVIQYGRDAFSRLHIVLATNPNKRYTFSEKDRLAMLQAATKGMANVILAILPHTQLLVQYAQEVGATTLLRGVRNGGDHDYERMMADFNEWLQPNLKTIFLGPQPHQPFISSSFIKSLVGMDGWQDYVSQLVPECVMSYLSELV